MFYQGTLGCGEDLPEPEAPGLFEPSSQSIAFKKGVRCGYCVLQVREHQSSRALCGSRCLLWLGMSVCCEVLHNTIGRGFLRWWCRSILATGHRANKSDRLCSQVSCGVPALLWLYNT